MKIIVCIKQVPDTSVPLDIEQDGQKIVEDGLVYIVNPEDLCAVETAVRLKESLGGEITVLTLGPPRAEEALRSCLALGADRAVLLQDGAFRGGDPFVTATALAAVIEKINSELILTGSRTLDGGHAQVPAAIAELLGLPFVSGVTDLNVVPGQGIALHRKLERGDREVMECSLPALVAVTEGIGTPRYASLPDVIASLRQEIEVLRAGDLNLRQGQIGERGSLKTLVRLTPPRPRPKKTFIPDSSLSPAERMRQLMTGGITQKKSGEILEGDPEQIASQVVRLLIDEKIVEAVK